MATYYWVGGTGTWDGTSTANWSTSTGGAAGAGPPTSSDTVVFDDNSGAGTCTTDTTAAATLVTKSSAALTLALGANLSLAGEFQLLKGAVTLNNYALTTFRWLFGGSDTRSINFGTSGTVVITGNNTSVLSGFGLTNFSYSGTSRVELTYSGSVGTRTLIYYEAYSESLSINIYVTAGSDSVTLFGGNGSSFRDVDFTGFSGTLLQTDVFIFGSLTFSPTMTVNAGTSTWRFGATTGVKTITTNGKVLDFPVLFSGGTAAIWRFEDNFSAGATRAFTFSTGTLNANNKNVSIGSFSMGSAAKTLILGSGTWTVAGNWDGNTNSSNLTVSASTGIISMTSASAKSFAGGRKTWPTLNQGGAGALTIQQSNTFANITNTVQPATITLTSGTTQTVTDFDVSGMSGNLITLNASTPGSRATLTDSGGVNSVSFVDIKDIAATGYGEWQAYTSNGNVDSGNNVGWVFAEPPPLTASEYQISLKSFTERRSF